MTVDVVMLLRVARVVMCFITMGGVLWLWMRRRVESWQCVWLLLYLLNQTAFSSYILIAGLANALDTSFARVWSLSLDIHNLFAMLFYLIVVARFGRRGNGQQPLWFDRRRRVDAGNAGADRRQLEIDLFSEWERERAWLSSIRHRADEFGVARTDTGTAA